MELQPSIHIRVMRAVSLVFINRKLTSILLLIILGTVALLAALVGVIVAGSWWLLLLVVIVPLLLLAAPAFGAVLFSKLALGLLQASQTSDQRQAVNEFVDKLERVADNIQTPVPIIVLKVLRDVKWPRENSFLKQITKDGSTLHSDYGQLITRYTK